MKEVLSVFTRCLAIEFYKQNAALFGLIFLIAFGFIKSSEHIALGSFLIANPSSLLFLYVLWIGYVFKVVLFIVPTLNREENHFMEAFYLFSSKNKIIAVSFMSMMLLIPVLAYSIFLIALAIFNSFYVSIISIALSLLILNFLLALILLKKLNDLPHEKSFVHIRLFSNIRRPSYLFFIEHLLRTDFVLLLLSKVYTSLMIIGTSALFSTGQFDLRLFSEGILLALVGNVAIMHKYIRFYYHDLKINANLPESFFKISAKHYATILLLLIPEIVLIVRHYPLDPIVIDVFGVIIFGFGIAVLMYGMLLIKQVELSDFVVQIFWLIVITTFLILFTIHPLILASMFILISITIMYLRQYKFEFIEKNK